MKLKSALAAFCVTSTVSVAAWAQDPAWLGDRQYREGPGFLVGNFELHTGAAADFGYDSNYLHRAPSASPIGSARFRGSANFGVATLGPQRRPDFAASPPSVGFRFELGATYNEFIPVSGGVDQNGDGGAADRAALRGQRDIDGFARFYLDILPGRSWSGRVYGSVTRAIRPTQDPIPGPFSTSPNFNRVLPGAGAEVVWAPGSGLLDWRLGYEFSGTFFESGTFSGLNSYRSDILTRGRWRFLPRTAMIYDGRFSFITYPSNDLNKTNSHPVRARIGATGLITPSFGVLAMVGWGASFYQANTDAFGNVLPVQDFNSVIGQAELRWYLQPTTSTDPLRVSPINSAVSVGFIRDFEDSFFGTYLEKDQGYVNFNYLFAGTFLLTTNVAVGAVVFPPQSGSPGNLQTKPGGVTNYNQPNGWTDTRVDGTLFGEYRIKDWVGVNAEVDYIGYFSKTTLVFDKTAKCAPGQIGSGCIDIAYQQVAAFAGARVFW